MDHISNKITRSRRRTILLLNSNLIPLHGLDHSALEYSTTAQDCLDSRLQQKYQDRYGRVAQGLYSQIQEK